MVEGWCSGCELEQYSMGNYLGIKGQLFVVVVVVGGLEGTRKDLMFLNFSSQRQQCTFFHPVFLRARRPSE